MVVSEVIERLTESVEKRSLKQNTQCTSINHEVFKRLISFGLNSFFKLDERGGIFLVVRS